MVISYAARFFLKIFLRFLFYWQGDGKLGKNRGQILGFRIL